MSDVIKALTSDSLLKASGVAHGFYTRRGGVSVGTCAGLNCGLGSEDNPEYVRKNRTLVARDLGASDEALLSVYQVHGNEVAVVEQPWPQDDMRPRADAMVTDKEGLALGIVTADCAPVLFSGQKDDGAPVVGAAHAGWKGALSGVLENTVSQMKSFGARTESIHACVGPCIAKASYEVTLDFIEPFLEHDEQSERFFHSASDAEHVLFDLAGYCAYRISLSGVRNVEILAQDTYKLEEDFYSFRRATHRSEQDYGRQISAIVIK